LLCTDANVGFEHVAGVHAAVAADGDADNEGDYDYCDDRDDLHAPALPFCSPSHALSFTRRLQDR
jgi:hypothetical protein